MTYKYIEVALNTKDQKYSEKIQLKFVCIALVIWDKVNFITYLKW